MEDEHMEEEHFDSETINVLLERLSPEMKKQPKEEQIEHVKHLLREHQKEARAQHEAHERYLHFIRQHYTHLHKDLLTLKDSFFEPSFLEAVRKGTPEALSAILTEDTKGVWSFQMLSADFCAKLLEEITHFEEWCTKNQLKVTRPNSMNNYGAILDEFGFYEVLQEWVLAFVQPLARLLFPHFATATLDEHHCFVVEYKIGKDVDLGFHVDDSEVTLNVCLGKAFQGGTLFFRGQRCAEHQNTPAHAREKFEYVHSLGRACLHIGRHRHGAHAILSGERYNLILWCRSSSIRNSSGGDAHGAWCGWRD